MNEKSWERTDKGGSSTESFDLRGRVSLLFLCSFLCRRVIAYLLSSSSKKKSTTTLHGGKSIFWERIPSLSFLKKEFQYRWGSLYRLKSRVLSFFFGIDFGWKTCFWIAETCETIRRLSSIHLRCSAYHDTRLS